MTEYETPLLHNSQDMMQELFEEINGYLGDKDTPGFASHASPGLSPFNVSTEGEEDEHPIEHTQNDDIAMLNQGETTYQTQSPLQPAMFVESDEEDSSTDNGDTRDSIHIEHDQNEQTVCMCYKCKHDQMEHSGQQQSSENTNYDKSSAASQFLQFKRWSKPASSSFGGAVGNAKLAHIAGLVKQTLTSTPRDIITSTATPRKRPTNDRRHSALSINSTSDRLDSQFIPLATSSSTTSRHSYNPSEEEETNYPPSTLSYHDNTHPEKETSIGGSIYHSNTNPGASFDRDSGYQDRNGDWVTTAAASMNWDSSICHDASNQNETGLYNEQDIDNTAQATTATTEDYMDSFHDEKQQLPDGSLLMTRQLPFLTPIHRVGEPHSVVLRTKLARDVGSHEDRINAYNNAYSHCIMARTDMVPWIKKQYSKGPPNLVVQYTPRPKKSSKSLFGLFKRHSKLGDTLPSTALTAANSNPDLSKLSVSSTRSSILTQSTNAVSPQPSFTPSDSYFPQDQQLHQQTNEAASSTNNEDMYLSPTDTIGLKIDKNISGYKPHEHHRTPSPSPSLSNGKKKSKSLASVTEPVSILKKSSSISTINTADRPGPLLKKSSSVSSFADGESSPGYRNKSPTSMSGFTEEDILVSNLMKNRSSSPSPSMESRRPTTRHRSPSPISYVSAPANRNNNSNSSNKRSQLLCPPDTRSPVHHHQSQQQQRQRSRSVSPSPKPSPSQRSRSSSPMSAAPPPMRRSSLLLDEHYEPPPSHHSYHHHHRHRSSSSEYQRSPSPSAISTRQYTAPPPTTDRRLSPRPYTNGDDRRHHRRNSHTSSPTTEFYRNNETPGRKIIHRARSNENYDHKSHGYAPPPAFMEDDTSVMMMDRHSARRGGPYRSSSPLHYSDASSYLLPLEQQSMAPPPPRGSSHRRIRSSSPMSPPLLPPSANNRAPTHRRRRSMMDMGDDYYYDEDDDAYVLKKPMTVARGSSNSNTRRQQQQRRSQPPKNDPLHDLCAFFHHLPRHVLAKYLQDAGGDFYLAKDLCMEDIMANGI
ncbi:unnamed protein product [Absidia cylindrospora]